MKLCTMIAWEMKQEKEENLEQLEWNFSLGIP